MLLLKPKLYILAVDKDSLVLLIKISDKNTICIAHARWQELIAHNLILIKNVILTFFLQIKFGFLSSVNQKIINCLNVEVSILKKTC